MAQPPGPHQDGPTERPPDRSRWTWPLLGPLVAGLFVAYFLLPARTLGPERPELSWALLILALTAIAALLLKHMRDALFDRPGTVVALMSLMCLSVLVFSSAYFVMSHHPGEFQGLRTRLDALYFTLLTVATVSYGDIQPRGQSARLVILLQILYTLVFLTAAATSLSGKLRRAAASRPPGGGREHKRGPPP
ncbi:two pore domain potassium channel family protein [Streptomyces diacarni]|uniref:Two pore domain potassium channel family protein n=1 Tax=Streptomyces diacarni TaxID=2800381 RepID=A0A367F050_9ACTN|nr:potassium channel family protein [Streptomyces diacarni]RCG23748.1 two pore domain potassium channel family protein [Streptomyces diacarni]